MKPNIYKVDSNTPGRLFIMPKPSGEWLKDDISYYQSIGVNKIASLLTNEEIIDLDLDNESTVCQNAGIPFHRFPINDRHTPKSDGFSNLVQQLSIALQKGQSIPIHCRAGIGRAGF